MSKSPISHRSLLKSSGWMAVYSPVLLAILLMLPRLIAPQFGLFDDGRTLVTADKISHGIWYTDPDSMQGRFRPVQWLWFTLSYLVGGRNPFWFYAANTLALVVVVAGLIYLVRAAGGSKFQAWLAGLAFMFAGPVAESFLTIKGEVIQLVLMLLSLLAVLPYAGAKSRRQKVGIVALTAAILLLADLAKETAIVLLPAGLAWYLLARFWPRYETDPARRDARGAYLVANLIAVPLFFLLRKTAIPAQITGGTYTVRYALQPGQVAIAALRWAGWLVRDFTWLVPLLLAAIILLISRRRLAGSVLLVESFVWMGAWICVYLPWNFMAEYYMLPFALGSAVFASALVAEMVPALRGNPWQRWTAILGAGLGILLLVGNLLGNLTNARVQLAVDSANADMLAYLVKDTEPGSTIIVNIQDPNEYFYEMQTQLGQVYNRPDLKVLTFRSGMNLGELSAPVYILAPFVSNQPLLTVRMGVIEATQNMWNDTLRGFMQAQPGWRTVAAPTEGFRLSDVNYPRIFCPLVKTRAFCATPAPLIDMRVFTYGWQVYKLEAP